jgi:predicted MFS family arabinose efflux permease
MTRPSPASRSHSDALVLVALCVASSLGVLNAMILSPFLSDMADDLNTSVALIGQAVTATAVCAALLGLLAGPLADGVGYRRLLLFGICMLALYDVGIALVPGLNALLVVQVFGGISGATVSPLSSAIAGTRFTGDHRRRAISRIYASASGASIIGFPILTTVGDASSWRWVFIVLAFVALAGVALILFAVPADAPTRTSRMRIGDIRQAYLPLLRHRPLALVYLGQFLRGACWVGMLTYVGAFFIDELGLSLSIAGFLWVFLSAGFLTGSLLVNGRLRRYDPRLTFMLTATMMGAFVAVMFLAEAPIPVSLALLFLGSLAGGVAEVTAVTVLANETTGPQGATMALNSSVVRFGTAAGASLGGALLALGGYPLVALGLPIVAVIGSIVVWFSRHRPVTPSPMPGFVRE